MNPLCRLSARDAVSRLRARDTSPLELVEAAAERIAQTDGALNAIPILCLDRAREHARRLMAEPPSQVPPHYLHGLPIVVKDNVDVAGVRCTRGSPLYAEHVPATSDVVVQRLEAHGAIVIGKSNIPEFAAGGNTYNEVFGATRNPWNTATTPGGSSGGTAAALAAGQVWLGTGNDFGGSIRLPASFCSLVGLRPTAGLVPRVQRQPWSPLNVEGPLARDVADCALMLACEAGRHPQDPLSWPVDPADYLAAAARPVAPRAIGFSLNMGVVPVVDPEVARVCTHAARAIEQAGCVVDLACPDLRDAERAFRTLRGVAFVGNMGPLLATHRDALKADVIANAEFGRALTATEIAAAETTQGEIVRRMAAYFERYDALLCPVAITPPFPVEQRHIEQMQGVRFADYLGWIATTTSISLTGCPVLTLPVGFTAEGLPVGMQLVGPHRSEARLLAMGAWIEQVLAVSPKPPIEPRAPADAAGPVHSAT